MGRAWGHTVGARELLGGQQGVSYYSPHPCNKETICAF